MVRAPEVYAWSGNQILGNTFNTNTRGNNVIEISPAIADYDGWCATWWPNNVPNNCPQYPENAVILTPDDFSNTYYKKGEFKEGETYVLRGEVENEYTGILLNNIPDNVTLYVEEGHWNLFDKFEGENLKIYIAESGDLLFTEWEEEQVLLKNVTIYNYGSTKIHVKANTIGDGCVIYDAGYLEIEENEQYEDRDGKKGDWSLIINQPILSKGEVYFKGDVQLGANSNFRKVCVDGDLTIDKDVIVRSGYMNADQINCETGSSIKMAPKGLMVVGTINMAKGSQISTETNEVTQLGNVLTNDILGDRKEDLTGKKDYGFKYLNKENFASLFENVYVWVTRTINNSQDKDTIESHVPGGKGFVFALMSSEEFDASDETDVNSINCGESFNLKKGIEVCEECGHPSHGETCPDCDDDEGCNHEDEVLCDKGCGHPSHGDGPCEECGEDEGCNEKENVNPNPTPDPIIPGTTITEIPDHVEVNLAIDRKDGVKWLASHLSIHVRANTDVEVFIPIPAKFYCDADDMAIVESHNKDLVVHGGPKKVEYNINGNVVTLTVAFEEDGIRVTTAGINQDVIDYLKEENGDGITFEVWNYFNIEHDPWYGGDTHTSIDPDDLKEILSGSTISFTNDPDLYVNAFNDTDNGEKFEYDCTVTPVTELPDEFNDAIPGYWFNGSPYNQLYWNKNYDQSNQSGE